MVYFILIFVLLLSGCLHIRPSATAKKDLGNSSKVEYEAKVEVYKDIDIGAIWEEGKNSYENKQDK